MSYGLGYTVEGFNANPIDYPREDDIDEEEKEALDAIEQQQYLNKHYEHFLKITAHAKNPNELVETTLRLVVSEILKSAVSRFCQLENLPNNFISCSWDRASFESIISQYLMALGVNFGVIQREELKKFLNSVFRNTREFSIYDRVGLLRDFVVSLKGTQELDKELMRQLLSISRLFINVIEFKNQSPHYLYKQIQLIKAEEERERMLSLPSYRGKKFVKNWKVRHLRSLLDYASKSKVHTYNEILKIHKAGTVLSLRKRLDEIIRNEMPLV